MASKANTRRLRGLYAITPETADTVALASLAAASLEGGARLLQYRAKAASPGVALVQARELRALCHAHRALFIVNDSIELALASGADGVHLGRDDDSPRAARIVFPEGLIGVSCYADPDRAREAAHAGADYVAIGSVFASATKPRAPRAPLSALAAAVEASGLPVVAIGGITLDNAPQAIAAGADMVAVIAALYDSSDVRATAAAFQRLFEGASPGGPDVPTQQSAL